MQNSQRVQEAASKKNLLFSTIDTFLNYKLSGHKSFKTEPSNASRTLLMELDTCQWDNELLNFFEVRVGALPGNSRTIFRRFALTFISRFRWYLVLYSQLSF